MNQSIKKIFPEEFNSSNLRYYYIPYFLLLGWIILSLIGFLLTGTSNLFNGFVIFSFLVRISISIIGLWFVKIIFLDQENLKIYYNRFKAFVGYGVVFSYVFYSLPRIVGEFYSNISLSFSIQNYIFNLITTFFPAVLYLLLRNDKYKQMLGFFNQKEIDYHKRVKKDKSLKKKEHQKLKSERSFIVNLWYEWIDVIIQAIIIAMLIQQFLFQMYQIPSESMVPTFLVSDRVMVNKLVYGPQVPLTQWKLPSPVHPKIGDIVVFKNPKMDDPDSDIKYDNVFARIFHPFIYMLTLSMVDIDKRVDYNGRMVPKERFLVKRLVAGEGEKICMVNDKIYKKTKESDWKLMSEIPEQKNYAHVDLYYSNTPQLHEQIMTSHLRSVLNEAEKEIDSYSITQLKTQLKDEKSKLLRTLKYKNINFQKIFKQIENIKFSYDPYMILNTISESYVKEIQDRVVMDDAKFQNSLKNYHYVIYNNNVKKLLTYLEKYQNNQNYFIENIYDEIIIEKDDSPYRIYMKKVNALYKISLLQLFNYILNKEDYIFRPLEDINKIFSEPLYDYTHQLLLIDIYLNDFNIYYLFPGLGASRDSSYFFPMRNFEDFPSSPDEYIKDNEYFMMGDNRYNSSDSRFEMSRNKRIFLDPLDRTDLSLKRTLSWGPHTIKEKHLLGKAKIIYYPLNRLTIFK